MSGKSVREFEGTEIDSVLLCVEYGSTFCLFACLSFCLFVCLFVCKRGAPFTFAKAIVDGLSSRSKQAISLINPFVSLVQISRTYTNARNAAIYFNIDQERPKGEKVYPACKPHFQVNPS